MAAFTVTLLFSSAVPAFSIVACAPVECFVGNANAMELIFVLVPTPTRLDTTLQHGGTRSPVGEGDQRVVLGANGIWGKDCWRRGVIHGTGAVGAAVVHSSVPVQPSCCHITRGAAEASTTVNLLCIHNS